MNKKKKPTKTVTTRKKRTKKDGETYNIPSSRNILICCVIGIVIALTIIIYNYYDNQKELTTACHCGAATAPIQPKERLRDINPEHLAHAKANGLKRPIKNAVQFEAVKDSLTDNDILKKIKSNQYYKVCHLTHSYPYLTPEAKKLLKVIALRFRKNLREADMPPYRFAISSLLRTEEFQRELQKVNPNATTSESAHYYGTTFDISYRDYYYRGKKFTGDDIEAVLEKTLKELRSECRLMIIRERSNKCFHITVVCSKEK